ncbi:uncharacterized protein BO97DRAFT_49166 [Aspergillus homomorphus CBS 101889]|uniref:Uncharacterized protein n=1 Tax=Aspergillus homomorphus (strain CBS 101889) TaxID=1450537 RepID=A0A395HZH1_ASPHC|nr:hypothetical protein BO97DRAFT_49166 [Aspergillus homomorphus CBS 101889]RAL12946.1 hypothetical protein BO97DRAFT_49166 [Aspergillus homomorphus CBS 101889]
MAPEKVYGSLEHIKNKPALFQVSLPPFTMKLSVSSVMVATTLLSAANAAFPSLPNIPESCLEIPKVLGNKPLQLLEYFHKEVCEQNCTATINQHNAYIHNQVLPQLIQSVDQRLGISAAEQAQFKQLHTEAVAAVQKSCSAEGNKPLCNDVKGLVDYGLCAFKATEPIFKNHLSQLQQGSVNITEAKCDKIKELDSDATVWQKTLPSYIDKFAKLCASEK